MTIWFTTKYSRT